ncbi:hypothetical protein BXZ70DRAFT_912163 [Cristinia sonorae]|uniref:C2 domain-containing protein n=1 Tax=Cristinia sonorae TaxID=1940300 RepID=A0A8K0XUV0_9AGAR|nr:hypothetical protein BXZ70DRAFT_912163 [Cristinia sonorae]
MDDALYTCQIIIHRATNVPVADIHNFSCDPYFLATLYTGEHKQKTEHPSGSKLAKDPEHTVTYRTHTVRSTLNPTFDAEWIVSGIPARGFTLSLKLVDEDPRNYDDKLGKAVIRFPPLGDTLKQGLETGEREYKVHKRRGVLASRVGTFVARVATNGKVGHRCRVWVSIKVIGKAEAQKYSRVYTLGPHRYVQHFSPVLGSFLGSTKAPNEDHTHPSLKASTFVANRMQLSGPVPSSLRHRYVGFAPFVKAMFKKRGIEGMLLHRALHRQHTMIYKWDRNTVCEVVKSSQSQDYGEDGQVMVFHDKRTGDKRTEKESEAFARQLLRMTSHGTHGRIFTYVIMLDGEWRFTETGEHLAIQFLSKHTMHSDVSIEIAFSGEFFIRPIHPSSDSDSDKDHPQSSDPKDYELIIDNDSGTYRPSKDLLPTLEKYLSSPSNLAAFGRVQAMDGFDEKLKKWKEERAEVMKRFSSKKGDKGKANGKIVQAPSLSRSGSGSSVSASSVSSEEGEALGLGRKASIGSSEVERAVEEGAKRAKENKDDGAGAEKEEKEAG